MLGEANTDRRSARREATKAEILDAAWEMVREHGLASLALRDLAAKVGMRAPSLYQYFDSKHAIYDAMFEQGARQALEQVADPVDAIADPREAMRAGAHAMFRFMTTDPARAQLLFQRTIPGFEPSSEAYAPAVELLDRTQARFAAFGVTDPAAVDAYTALISGLCNQQIANDPGGDRWGRLIDRMYDMWLAEFAPHVASKKKSKK
jgi:AcrR family transcriptional regulator